MAVGFSPTRLFIKSILSNRSGTHNRFGVCVGVGFSIARLLTYTVRVCRISPGVDEGVSTLARMVWSLRVIDTFRASSYGENGMAPFTLAMTKQR